MFAASARSRPSLALRSAQPVPLSINFSTSAPAGKGRIPRVHGPRNGSGDPAPRSSSPTARTHRLPPHRNALSDWRLLFHTRTRWIARTLARGKWIPPKLLSNILVNRHIPVQQLTLWVDVLSKRDLYEAMERLGLLESGGEDRERVEFPDWLFLSLPGLLRSADQAPYLASMLGSPRYRQLSEDQQGLFASRCIQHFLELGHYVAVRETVEWLCYHEQQVKSAMSFARCLSALGSHRSSAYGLQGPPYELLSSLTRLLRSTMARRGVKPNLEVFRALFRPALIPREPKDVARLVLEMEQAGLPPKRRILHQAMTVYARAGDVEGAEMFYRQIVGAQGKAGEAVETEGEDAEGKEVETMGYPAGGVYGTTRLRAFGDDIKAAFAYFDLCLQTPHRRGLPGTLPPLFDGVTWSNLFHIASSSPTVSSQDLLNVLRKLEKAASAVRTKEDDTRYIPPRPSLYIYHSVMLGLLRRHDPRLVANLWVSLRARGLEPDNHLLDAVLRAYLALDDSRSALTLLDQFGYKPSEDPPLNPTIRHRRLSRSTSPPPSAIPNTLQLDVVPLNNLLHYYNRSGYTFKCYRLFLKMQSTYGVQPDAATLSILIDAARYSSAAAGLGYGPGSEAIDVSGVRGKGQDAAPDDLWGDESKGGRKEHAWKVAETLCWEVLEGNWPEGVDRVKDPMEGGGVVNWLLGRGGEGASSSNAEDSHASSDLTTRPTFPATLSLVNPPSYPYLYPTERVFRSFIQLLGYHSTPRDIPLVLAWMRYIGIKPSRHTLTLAMLYVGELGLEERKMGRWRSWLREWLGEEEVPAEEEVAFVRRGGGKAGKPIRR